uniref:Uncharacterized protein n=1 Tax=Bionectria ochroleuca TaxID=29856 RepID=A0A0B7JWT8_BIOOC
MAFNKVNGAANSLEVDETIISKIVEWDGKKDIHDDADSDNESMNDTSPVEDEITPPPPQIIQIYKSATPALLEYQTNSYNDTTQISDINQKIIDHNQTFNKGARDDQKVQENSWVIPDNLITLYEQYRDHQLEFWSSKDKVFFERSRPPV